MKVAVLCTQSGFTPDQQKSLATVGEIVYTTASGEMPVDELIKHATGAEILAADPDNLGGFEKAKPALTKIMETLHSLKGVCLSTTSSTWIDLDYCKKRQILIANIPGYSRESVAEHALGMLLGTAKKIFVSDRKTQRGKYEMQMGTELKGKTLGVLGLGSIGSRVAELGQAIGMKVIANNRSPKKQSGVEMKSFADLLKEADYLSLNLTLNPDSERIINEAAINNMKDGVTIIDTTEESELIDRTALAKALKSGKINTYVYESADLDNELKDLENAIGLKDFGWYTKEALQNLYQIWTDNIIALSKGTPQNIVV